MELRVRVGSNRGVKMSGFPLNAGTGCDDKRYRIG